ncbi:MAG TPA: flagellar basal body rod protein FlgB [Phenylobacterium sp.]|nr:flagellar basal body rod protein FlgB [Phenylobacterium sp.]
MGAFCYGWKCTAAENAESLKSGLTLFLHPAGMDLGDIPLFAMLKGRLGYLADRQRVIAENVANADTPGYIARDLKPYTFQSQVQAAAATQASTPGVAAAGAMAVTQPGHIQKPGAGRAGAKPIKHMDSEETLDGNAVVLEDEMIKLTDARMEYDTAVSLYQQSMGMLKTAIRKPGG